jgi:hypothetical protein
MKSVITIDLHGIKHEDVKRVLIAEIERYWGQECDYYIITGNSSEMRRIACEIIREYQLDWSPGLHSAYLYVRA